MDYVVQRYNGITRFQVGLTELADENWNLHSFSAFDGVIYAVFWRSPAPVKEPAVAAKVVSIDGCKFHSTPEFEALPVQIRPAIILEPGKQSQTFSPGGCVSVPESESEGSEMEWAEPPVQDWSHCSVCNPKQPGPLQFCKLHIPEKSLSEQMEEILEPRPWDHAPVSVNKHGKE